MRSIDRLREYVKDAPASSMGEMARTIVMADHHGRGGIRYRKPEDVCKCYKQGEDA